MTEASVQAKMLLLTPYNLHPPPGSRLIYYCFTEVKVSKKTHVSFDKVMAAFYLDISIAYVDCEINT